MYNGWQAQHSFKWQIQCFRCHEVEVVLDAAVAPKALPQGWMLFNYPHLPETTGVGYPVCDACVKRIEAFVNAES